MTHPSLSTRLAAPFVLALALVTAAHADEAVPTSNPTSFTAPCARPMFRSAIVIPTVNVSFTQKMPSTVLPWRFKRFCDT